MFGSLLAPILALFGGAFAKEKATELATSVATKAIKDVLRLPVDAILTPEHVRQVVDTPEILTEFHVRIKEVAVEEMALQLKNTEGARAMYQVSQPQTDKISDAIIRYNLWVAGALLIINILAFYVFSTEAGILAAISNLIGMEINSVLSERNTVINFYMGSSLGSKEKDHKEVKSKA